MKRQTWTVVGLMSGTSTDGIDTALVTLMTRDDGYTIGRMDFRTQRYSTPLRQRLLAAAEGAPLTPEQLGRLHADLGMALAHAVERLQRQSHRRSRIDLIGSHGHTIFHGPPGSGRGTPTTLQIGEPAIIAARTGITTVADFRPADVALGGQGAPLVPHVHALLFRDRGRNRAIHNLGGISNVTFLPASSRRHAILAFDTGPGNMVIDAVTAAVTRSRLRYDHDGKLAARGIADPTILRQLLRHPYLARKPPKSTGREEFGESFVDALLRRARTRRLAAADIVATATAFTAHSVARAYRDFLTSAGGVDEVYFCGGGSRNPTLVAMLATELQPAKVGVTDDLGVDADAMEAIAFAVLAVECVRGRAAGLPAVTGASRPAILGKIVPGTLDSFRRLRMKLG